MEGKTGRFAALALASALALAACGARLSDDQRAAALGADNPSLSAAGDAGFDSTQIAAARGGGAGPLQTARTAPGSSTDPLLGNGGATDIGVSANAITLATVADVSGLAPGIFKAAHQGMAAAAAQVNSSGGIHARRLRLLLIDSRASGTHTQAAVAQACDQAFAMVGSISGFDYAGADTGARCGIPDVSAMTLSVERTTAPNVFAVAPIRPDVVPLGPANYFRQRYPDETRKAAMLWLNVSATRTIAAGRMKAYESTGFRFVYRQELQVLEGNYSPFVYAMRDAGVEWMTMIADDVSIARMLTAMDDAGWRPRVVAFPSTAYTPRLIERAGPAADGSIVWTNVLPFEEIASNPEMKLYVRWLAATAPGAEPDFYGAMAWSAGRLFARAALAAGPQLTRARLIAELRKVRSWDGYGLHAPHDVAAGKLSGCFVVLGIRDERFSRIHPSDRLACDLGGIAMV